MLLVRAATVTKTCRCNDDGKDAGKETTPMEATRKFPGILGEEHGPRLVKLQRGSGHRVHNPTPTEYIYNATPVMKAQGHCRRGSRKILRTIGPEQFLLDSDF